MSEPFISQSCIGEHCHCHEAAAHKVEESVARDDPYPDRHPFTAYVCHRHFVELMGPAADHPPPTLEQRFDRIAREMAHDLWGRNCFVIGGDATAVHSPDCEAAYRRIKETLSASLPHHV